MTKLSVALLALLITTTHALSAHAQSQVKFQVTGSEGLPIPCRIHLTDQSGKSFFGKGLPKWNDHFVCEGNATQELGNRKTSRRP